MNVLAEGSGALDPIASLALTIIPALGRKMFAMNAAPAGSLAPVRRDPRVLPIEFDTLRRDAREQLLAGESPWRRVAGLLDECAAVSMNRRLAPPDGLPRRTGQWTQPFSFGCVEVLEGALVGGPMNPHTGDLSHPALDHLVELVDVARGTYGRHEVALEVAHACFDLALLLGAVRRRRVDLEPEVASELAVAAVENRFGGRIESSSKHGCFEIVGNDDFRDSAEPLECLRVQAQPRLELLVEHDSGELVSRMTEHHDEDVRLTNRLFSRVPELSHRSEVDLRDLPGHRVD